jgi:transcriptional regulator with XRE-family HTH domain
MTSRGKPGDRQRFLALLRQIRAEAGLRQEDLAAKLGEPQSFVSRFESGERRVDVLELRDICEALGTTLVEFVRRLEGESP